MNATLVRVRRWSENEPDLPGIKELQVANFNGKDELVRQSIFLTGGLGLRFRLCVGTQMRHATRVLAGLAEVGQQRDLWRNEALTARAKVKTLGQRVRVRRGVRERVCVLERARSAPTSNTILSWKLGDCEKGCCQYQEKGTS